MILYLLTRAPPPLFNTPRPCRKPRISPPRHLSEVFYGGPPEDRGQRRRERKIFAASWKPVATKSGNIQVLRHSYPSSCVEVHGARIVHVRPHIVDFCRGPILRQCDGKGWSTHLRSLLTWRGNPYEPHWQFTAAPNELHLPCDLHNRQRVVSPVHVSWGWLRDLRSENDLHLLLAQDLLLLSLLLPRPLSP